MLPFLCRMPFFECSHLLPRFQIHGPVPFVFFSTSASRISIYDYLVNRHHFSPQCASHASASSSTKFISKPQNADSVLNFLAESGFSRHQIGAVVQKEPRVLSSNLKGTIKPKIKVFQDLGFHSSDFADIISSSPFLLINSADKLRRSILLLKNVLGSHADICRFLKNSGNFWMFWVIDKQLVPNIDYLKSCGICPSQIAKLAFKHSVDFLSRNPEKLKSIVRRVDEMGVLRESKMFLYAVRVMSSMSRVNWERKLKLLREIGFSEQNILHAFRKAPCPFGQSERKIKEATQILLSVTDINYVAKNPQLFSYSVEKRLKPRLRVLKALESKNLINRRPILTSFLQMTDAKFIDKYVSPYSEEVGDVYAGKQGL